MEMSLHLVNFSVGVVGQTIDGNASGAGGSGDQTDMGGGLEPHSTAHLLATTFVLGTIILSAIVGNVFVMAAVVLERNLRTVANYLVVSLAVADLMVATLVMPLAALNEVSQRWFLGREVCDIWVSLDVICCTASILHLVAISLDRYWAVTRVDYIHNRSATRILAMIGSSWTLSLMISIPPLFLQNDPGYDPTVNGTCMISQDPGYTIYSTVGAFYLPFVLMVIVYLRVFLAARARIRKKQFRGGAAVGGGGGGREAPSSCPVDDGSTASQSPTEGTSMTTFTMAANSMADSPEHSYNGTAGPPLSSDSNRNEAKLLPPPLPPSPPPRPPPPPSPPHLHPPPPPPPSSLTHGDDQRSNPRVNFRSSFLDLTKQYLGERKSPSKSKEKRAKERMEQKRERKAARTLAIITGSFIFCWLPFFILALVRPFCLTNCDYPPLLLSVTNWLGYFNSLLNPVIYTVFNPDFRSAFRKILFGKYRRRSKYQPANSLVH